MWQHSQDLHLRLQGSQALKAASTSHGMSWEQSSAEAEGEHIFLYHSNKRTNTALLTFTVQFPEATAQIFRSDLPPTAKPKGQTSSSSQAELPDKHREPRTVRWMKTGDRNHLRIHALERFNSFSTHKTLNHSIWNVTRHQFFSDNF